MFSGKYLLTGATWEEVAVCHGLLVVNIGTAQEREEEDYVGPRGSYAPRGGTPGKIISGTPPLPLAGPPQAYGASRQGPVATDILVVM